MTTLRPAGSPPCLADDWRFQDLDGLRGLCALWVVVFHLTTAMPMWLRGRTEVLTQIVPFSTNIEGLLGVDLFFLVSGFVISISVARSIDPLAFAVSRAARLLPAYWAAVVLATTVGLLAPLPWTQPTLLRGLVNLTMLQDYLGVAAVNPSFWSLSVELGFYVLMALVIVGRQQRRMEPLGLLWVGCAVVLMRVLPAFGLTLPWRVSTLTALPYAPMFVAGLLFYRARTEGWTRLRAVGIIACLGARMAMAPAAIAPYEIAIFTVFGLCVAGWLPWLRARPLVFLGATSYSLYVLHQPVAFWLQLGLLHLGFSPWWNLAGTVALLILLSASCLHWVEKPGGRLIRRSFTSTGRA